MTYSYCKWLFKFCKWMKNEIEFHDKMLKPSLIRIWSMSTFSVWCTPSNKKYKEVDLPKEQRCKKTPKKIELGTWLIDWLLRIAVVISYTPENLFFQIVPTQFCNLVRLRKWQTEDSSCRQVVDCYLFRNKNK